MADNDNNEVYYIPCPCDITEPRMDYSRGIREPGRMLHVIFDDAFDAMSYANTNKSKGFGGNLLIFRGVWTDSNIKMFRTLDLRNNKTFK